MVRGILGAGIMAAGAAAGLMADAAGAQDNMSTAPAKSAQSTLPAAAAPMPAAAPLDPFQQLIVARQVADFARRERDPYAMLTAAKMLQQVPMTDDAAPVDGDVPFSPTALFAEARALARGDQTLLLQIRLAQSAGRGVTESAFGKGLVRRVLDVDGRNAYRFSVTARGGEPLRIGAIGNLGTNMYIRLTDASGRQLCLDDNADYAPVCAVTPRASGNYQVSIGNKSAARSRTVIVSN